MTLAIGITLLIIAMRPLICVSRSIWINRTRSRHVITACIVIILAAGCAQNVPKTPGYFAETHDAKALTINKVALATDTSPPVIDSVDLGFTRGEGAASGAAGGAAAGASVPLEILGDCHEAICLATLILLLPVFLVGGAVVGAVSGGVAGEPADLLAQAETNAQNMLNSAYVQTEILKIARAYGDKNTELEFVLVPRPLQPDPQTSTADYTPLLNQSIDVVLEIDLLKVSLQHALEMEAEARLISVETGDVLNKGHYRFVSEKRRVKEWMADGAAPLTEAIRRGLATLAEDAIDENFLLYYPEESKNVSNTYTNEKNNQPDALRNPLIPHYVLSAISPEVERCVFCEVPFGRHPHRAWRGRKFVKANSNQLTLRWERFPREFELSAQRGQPQQITDVLYDLRVYDAAVANPYALVPAQLLYDERGINEPQHKLAIKLEPCTDYFWTVRARFKINGKPRVTEWAGAFESGPWDNKPWNLRAGIFQYKEHPYLVEATPDGPEWYYYSFMTPCDTASIRSKPVY